MPLNRVVFLAALLVLAPAYKGSAQATGADIYKAKCQMCHGVTGAADTPAAKTMRVKSFKDPDVEKIPEAILIGTTRAGTGKMPAFKDKLSDADLKSVITYVRTLEK